MIITTIIVILSIYVMVSLFVAIVILKSKRNNILEIPNHVLEHMLSTKPKRNEILPIQRMKQEIHEGNIDDIELSNIIYEVAIRNNYYDLLNLYINDLYKVVCRKADKMTIALPFHAFCISLKRSTDRRNHIEQHVIPKLNNASTHFHIVDAIDGQDSDVVSIYENTTDNELACTLSHLKAWKHATLEHDDNDEWFIVFEDDVLLDTTVLSNINLEDLIHYLPDDADVLQLFKYYRYGIFKNTNVNNEHVDVNYFYKLPKGVETASTLAYVIRKSSAKRILDMLLDEDGKLTCDKKTRIYADALLYNVANTYILKDNWCIPKDFDFTSSISSSSSLNNLPNIWQILTTLRKYI